MQSHRVLILRLLLHQTTTSCPLLSLAGKYYLVTERSHPVERYVYDFKSIGCPCGICPHEACTSDTDRAMALDGTEVGRKQATVQYEEEQSNISLNYTESASSQDSRRQSDHEAVLLPIVGHEDNVPVGSPDEPGQPEGVVRARGRGLHWRYLVGLDAAQLRC